MPRSAVKCKVGTVQVAQNVDDMEPETKAVMSNLVSLADLKERALNVFDMLRLDARAVVGHGNPERIFIGVDLDHDLFV